MITVNRREVLKALATLGLSSLPLPFGLRNLVFAADDIKPTLIVVHLRGGCDGLNLISPADDPDFIAARASDLRVAASGEETGYSLANGPAANVDFRLHKAGGGLAELYKSTNLAFIHACGLTDATRSHFVATDMIEAGVSTQADLARSNSGWLTRCIRAQGLEYPDLQAVSVSAGLSGDLRGLGGALAAPDINNGLSLRGGAPLFKLLAQMYGERDDALGRPEVRPCCCR